MQEFKQRLNAALLIVALTGLIIAIPQVILVGMPLWKKYQESPKECVQGKPIPKEGCYEAIGPLRIEQTR
jgi:hypothetical protein